MSIMIDRIYNFLRERPGERFDDGEIQKQLGIKNRAQVNSRCRKLAEEGKIVRKKIDGVLKNFYKNNGATSIGKDKIEQSYQNNEDIQINDKQMVRFIDIPLIILRWSPWFPWENFEFDLRYSSKGVSVPSVSGVYEAKIGDGEERLTIGKASNLRMRVKQGLVKGKTPHSGGRRIRANEDLSVIIIRWATTDRPSCVEEELHRQYRKKFGRLPKYTLRT